MKGWGIQSQKKRRDNRLFSQERRDQESRYEEVLGDNELHIRQAGRTVALTNCDLERSKKRIDQDLKNLYNAHLNPGAVRTAQIGLAKDGANKSLQKQLVSSTSTDVTIQATSGTGIENSQARYSNPFKPDQE